jgi:hypothetical protein
MVSFNYYPVAFLELWHYLNFFLRISFFSSFIIRNKNFEIRGFLQTAALYLSKYSLPLAFASYDCSLGRHKYLYLQPRALLKTTHTSVMPKRVGAAANYQPQRTVAHFSEKPLVFFYNVFFLTNLISVGSQQTFHHRFDFFFLSRISTGTAVIDAGFFLKK